MDREMEQQVDQDLEKIYFDPANSGSYGGVERLYNQAKTLGYSRDQVKNWLKRQDVYTVFKQVNRQIHRPKVIVPYKNYEWDMDTVNMTGFVDDNNGYAYILVILDIFTRFLITVPLQSLTGKEMAHILGKIFLGGKPVHCRTDLGSEFINKNVEKLLQENKINHIKVVSETKANFAEAVIKNIKKRLTRYMYDHQTHKWIDVLSDVTASYNSSYHRSIQMSPVQALSSDNVNLWHNQYGRLKKFVRGPNKLQRKYLFDLNDQVRISKYRKSFERAYDQKWSDEIFLIAERGMQQNIPVYTIKDFQNQYIVGKFYTNQLVKVEADERTVYKIEKLVRRKKIKKQDGYIVKWLGWSEKYNSFVPLSEIKDIKNRAQRGIDGDGG